MKLRQTIKITTLFFLLILAIQTNAQVTITPATTPPFTPTNLINQVFLGNGVTVTNVTYTGSNTAVGAFNNGLSTIGIESGIVMTTGDVTLLNTTTNNNSGSGTDNGAGSDTDLASIAGTNINNAAVYTIDFIPTADTLRFNYVFASEEYPDFVCSINDVFGFFISGPGFNGPFTNMATNIALVPGTATPVGVNTINNGNPTDPSCGPTNATYYIDNDGNNTGGVSPYPIVFDGFTTVLTAQAIVTPCSTYRIKLAVGDAVDGILDSGVFLAANSFGTSGLTADVNTPNFTSTIAEGCEEAEIVFRLESALDVNYPINYTIGGNAVMGQDYANIPLNPTIQSGQDSLAITITALQDAITEPQETISIVLNLSSCQSDTFLIFISDRKIVDPVLTDTTICLGDTVNIDATLPLVISNGVGFSNTNSATINNIVPATSTINVSNLPLKNYLVGAIDSVCFNISHQNDEDLDIYLNSPTGEILELSTDNGGNGNNYTSTCFVLDTTNRIVNGSAPFTDSYYPEGDWADLNGADLNGAWSLTIIDDQAGFNGTLLDWSIHFAPIYNLDYQWTPSTGIKDENSPIISIVTDTTRQYNLQVQDTYGCISEDSTLITVLQPLDTPIINCAFEGSNSIVVDWSTIPNATNYQINVDNSGWVSLAGTATSYTINSLNENQSYEFWLQPLDGTCPEQGIDTAICMTELCTMVAIPATTTNISCNGLSDGSANITVNNPIGSVTYVLNGTTTQNNGNFTGLAAGNYKVIMTDSINCVDSVSFFITQPTALVIDSLTSTPLTCNGDNSGTATVFPSGGTTNYTYSWSSNPNQTTITATGLAATNYTVTVTDANNCTITDNITLTEPPLLTVAMQSTDVLCNGDNSGLAIAIPNGGIAPYLYLWNTTPPQSTDTAFNLNIGNYEVTITDANNCTIINNVNVVQPNPMSISMSSTPATCYDSFDGTGTANPSGGVSPYSFQWDTISNSNTTTQGGLSRGMHYVTITDINGCTLSDSVNVGSTPEIITTTGENPASCFGVFDGSVSIAATGGSGGFTYAWNTSPVSNGAFINNLFNGEYIVTVTDVIGCTALDTATIAGPVLLTSTKDSSEVTCYGGSDGMVSITPNGGTGNYTYSWNNGAFITDSVLTNVVAGTYNVYIQDANGCARIDSMIVNTPAEFLANLTMTQPDCNGFTNGTASISPSGGTAGYVFNWGNNSSFNTITGLSAGFYQVTLTDALNCIVLDTIEVTQPDVLALSTDTIPVICFGENNGKAWVTVTGGNTSFDYSWNTTPTNITDTILNQPTGLYQVVVTDDKNCQDSSTVFIRQPDLLTVGMSEIPVSCFNGSDGQAIAAPSGGNYTYTYAWSVPQTNDTIANLTIGSYQVTVTDAKNCTTTGGINVTEPPILDLTMSQIPTSCFQGNDGTAIVSVIGGTPYPTGTYTFEWNTSPTQSDSIATNLLATQTYSVIVMDANNCEMTDSIQIGQPAQLTTSMTHTPVICNNETNGTATVTPTGGTLPYSYNWSTSPVQADAQAFNLTTGMYYVTVTDGNNCSTIDSVFVTEPTPIDLIMDSTNVSCYNFSDGKAWITASGGVGGFNYNWIIVGNPSIDTLSNVPVGFYQVRVTDANDCVDSAFVNLTQPDTLAFTFTPDSVNCYNGNDGSILTNTIGGTGDYTYQWSNTTIDTSNVFDLIAGIYTLTVTDDNSCISIDSIEIGEPEPFIFSLTQHPPTCHDGSDGWASATTTGGIQPYNIVWNIPTMPTTDTIFNLTGDIYYSVTGTDANGCITTDSIMVVNPDSLVLTMTGTDEACQQGNNGTTTATVTGGFTPYQYLWDVNTGSQTTMTATGLDAGNYAVTITDDLGCQANSTVSIALASGIKTEITNIDVLCKNETTAWAFAKGLTGTAPYSFQWDANANNQTSDTASNLGAGTYFVTITDALGCFEIDTAIISEPNEILLLEIDTVLDVTCFGDRDGLVKFHGTGGTMPYRYQFNNRNFTQTITWGGLEPGNYPILIQDNNGCEVEKTLTINEPLEFTIDLGDDVYIEEGDTAQISVNTINGFAPFSYFWMPYDTLNMSCGDCPEPIFTGLLNTSRFAVEVTDSNGCVSDDFIFIYLDKELEVYVATGFTPNNDLINDYLLVQGAPNARVVSFAIYDRWGEKVYQTNDAPLNDTNFGWNGDFKGQPAPSGVYGWIVEIEFIEGTKKVFKGNTTLIR
jgi:gliding motility-associated-like protein